MSEKTFEDREIIFQEGDLADLAYVIRAGSVEILKHGDSGEIKLAELKEGEVFGEMGLFDPQTPRSATARAKGDTAVDIITGEELHSMIEQCPPRLVPIVVSVFDRLRATNQRVKTKEQATALLESDVDKIHVSPSTEKLRVQFEAMEMPVAHLPFKIGGFPIGGEIERTKSNHLNLESEGPPLMVSSNHCEVAIEDGKLYLRDLGSRFGTVVNDLSIGRGKGVYKAPLEKGDNKIILGDKRASRYHLNIRCE